MKHQVHIVLNGRGSRRSPGGEETPEALERGGINLQCPICFEKKDMGAGQVMVCCGQHICFNFCRDDHRDTCRRRSLEETCPYCRYVVINAGEGGETIRLLIKQGENVLL